MSDPYMAAGGVAVGGHRDQNRADHDQQYSWIPPTDYKGWTVSTIGEEKRNNPRLQVRSIEGYVRIMRALKLPDPTLMDIAVPANLQCGKRRAGLAGGRDAPQG